MLKKLFQQLIRFFARLFSSHSKPFEFPKGSKKPPIRLIIFVHLVVQPVFSDSMEPSACSIDFLEKKAKSLKIKVNKDESIEMEEDWIERAESMIVIGFENNRDGYSNIKQQIESLRPFTYLLDHYHFSEFKAVGHSNGGWFWLVYWKVAFWKKKATVSSLLLVVLPIQSRDVWWFSNMEASPGKK